MSDDPPSATPLYCRDEGSGSVVALVHGLGGDHTIWNELVPPLAQHFRVLVPDLRGHGRTPAPSGSNFSFPEMEGDLLHLLDSKQVETLHLVGFSAGGFLTLQMAVDHPERLKSFTIINGSSHCDNHTKAILDRWSETFREEGFDAYALRLLKDLFYPDWIEAHLDYADAFRDELKKRDLASFLAWGAAIRSFDVRSQVHKIRRPALIIQAMDDQVVDGSHGRLLRQSIFGAELKIDAATGHFIPIERPTETIQALIEFVSAVESRSRTVPPVTEEPPEPADWVDP